MGSLGFFDVHSACTPLESLVLFLAAPRPRTATRHHGARHPVANPARAARAGLDGGGGVAACLLRLLLHRGSAAVPAGRALALPARPTQTAGLLLLRQSPCPHRAALVCIPRLTCALPVCWQAHISMGDIDLLPPPRELEQRRHKLKRLVQTPNSFFMDVKCPGCFNMCAPAHSDRALGPHAPARRTPLISSSAPLLVLSHAVLRSAAQPSSAMPRPWLSAAAAPPCSASRRAARRG